MVKIMVKKKIKRSKPKVSKIKVRKKLGGRGSSKKNKTSKVKKLIRLAKKK